jgi:branched-chain amino acid transport system ATP-binding protein
VSSGIEVRGLAGGRSELTVFRDIDIAVPEGAMHAILGPNGAGKTTLMLTLAGLLPAHGGTVAVDGQQLRTGRAVAASRAGVVLVPDNRELFATLTVDENLRVPAPRSSFGVDSMYTLFPELAERRQVLAGSLSGGEQQMLAMARAIVQRPKVLLVDELSMGLAPVIVERLFGALRQAADNRGCAVVFVEQYVHVAMRCADSATVINRGSVVLAGPTSELASQVAELERAYLGKAAG